MPATRRLYTWSWRPPEPRDADYLCHQVQRVVDEFLTDWPSWYSDGSVSGGSFGLVAFSVVVTSRDQWWVAKRVRRLLTAVSLHTEVPVLLLNEHCVKLPPHTHRGKRYLEAARGSSD
jgi:hypothetical protein